MFRKLISQKGSHTVTLPKDWVAKNNLSEKDSVQISENSFSGDLNISKADQSSKKHIEVVFDTKNLDLRNIMEMVNQVYKLGYDTIILKNFDEAKDLEIKKLVDKKYLGFNAYRRDQSIIIESILEDSMDENKIDNMIRKIFFLIKETCDADSKDIDFLIANTDKHANYLRRIIIKYNYKNKLAYTINSTITRCNTTQHAIARLKKHIDKDKKSQEMIPQLKSYFELFEKAYNKLEIEYFVKVDNQKKVIDASIDTLLDKKRPHIKYMYEYVRLIQLASNASRSLLIEKNIAKP